MVLISFFVFLTVTGFVTDDLVLSQQYLVQCTGVRGISAKERPFSSLATLNTID